MIWTMYELGNDKGVSPPNPQNQIIEAEVDPGLIFFHPSLFLLSLSIPGAIPAYEMPVASVGLVRPNPCLGVPNRPDC
jgi:hypothetical protein